MAKKIIILVSIILFGMGLNCFAEDVGRYQLFQGEYPFTNLKGEQYWEKALFKIDTVTGEVWMGSVVQVMDMKKVNSGWQIGQWNKFEHEVQVSNEKNPLLNLEINKKE